MEEFDMISKRSVSSLTSTAAALGLALSLSVPGVASAQSASSGPSDTAQKEQKDSTGKHVNQETMDREKTTLKAQAQEQIDAANANIDELRRLSGKATGTTKKQHDDLGKKLSTSRDNVKGELNKVENATVSDWRAVRPAVEHDVTALNMLVRKASAITNVPAPQMGSTNKQPQTP
jgi:hypothetical protein